MAPQGLLLLLFVLLVVGAGWWSGLAYTMCTALELLFDVLCRILSVRTLRMKFHSENSFIFK
jgi:hypothetical protein